MIRRELVPRLALLLLVSGCGRKQAGPEGHAPSAGPNIETPAPPASSASAVTSAAASANPTPAFVGTVGILDVPRQTAPSVLTAVRAAQHEGYDRIVFEFRGTVPGYHTEYIDRPVRDCGAGEPRPIAGDAWLEVRISPADAHDDQGRPTVAERELRPNLRNVIEIERTCDFEAVVTWVLGTRSPNRYRVLELSSPSRLVVDVRH